MAKYTMQEMDDLHREGGRLLYPRMIIESCCGTDQLACDMEQASTFAAGEIRGMLDLLARELAAKMAGGQSVRLEGIGTFTPSLSLRDGRGREEADGSGTRRNAGSIEVGGVNFRPSRELVRSVNRMCRLERSPRKFVRRVSEHTPQERLELARAYLKTHPWLTQEGYAGLTGLSRTTAGRELRRWKDTPGSGIAAEGRGTHRVYVAAETDGE